MMARAQAGDAVIYHQLLSEITPYVRAIVSRQHPGGGHDCEDTVQDVLLTVHRIRHSYEPGRPFRPWLATIANRRMIDLLRRNIHRGRHEVAVGDDIVDMVPTSAIEDGPEQASENAQRSRRLREALAQLPDRQREAFELLRVRQLSAEQAAAVSPSGQSAGAIKVACHRALKSLRRFFDLEEAGDG